MWKKECNDLTDPVSSGVKHDPRLIPGKTITTTMPLTCETGGGGDFDHSCQ